MTNFLSNSCELHIKLNTNMNKASIWDLAS